MSLGENVLLFDKNKISEEQIASHVKHYVELANKGLKIINDNRQEALLILKEIRITMSEEYKYYTKSKVQSIMWDDDLYSQYYHFIQNAFVKQNSPNSYRTLGSNLYDVMDYGRYYFRKYLTEEES